MVRIRRVGGGGGGLEIGVLCFARRNIAACESALARNNKAPAISRARRNRARISLCLIKLLQFWGRCDWRVITSFPLRCALPPAMAPDAISGPDTRPLRPSHRRGADFSWIAPGIDSREPRVRKLTRSGIHFFLLTSANRGSANADKLN